MESRVARVQPGGVLKKQSVPPILPAYNRFMGGVATNAPTRCETPADFRHYSMPLATMFVEYVSVVHGVVAELKKQT